MKTFLAAKVHPRSKKPGVEKIGEKLFKIAVQAAPEKGAANCEMISLLAKHLDLPPSRIKIIRGHAARHKIIQVDPDR